MDRHRLPVAQPLRCDVLQRQREDSAQSVTTHGTHSFWCRAACLKAAERTDAQGARHKSAVTVVTNVS